MISYDLSIRIEEFSERMLRFVIVLLTLLAVIGCSSESSERQRSAPDKNAGTDSLIIKLSGSEGKSVFEITQESHQVSFIESPVGNFVEAIDSIEIGHGYSWIYSVNDSMGQVASDKFMTKTGDRIKWHYRKF